MKEVHSFRVHERATGARLVIVGVFLLLVGAFFRTQVLDYDRFRLRAESNRLRPVPLQPARGTIYDRQGQIIAETVPGYSVALLASSTDSMRQVLERFDKIVPLDSDAVETVLNRYLVAHYQPALVLGNATREQVSRLEEHRASLPGLVIQSEPRRVYPSSRAVSHLVGYVGEVTQADLDNSRYANARLGTVVGRSGLEQQYDDTLRGIPGVRYIEVDARGRLVREQGAAPPLPPVAGRSLRTTIAMPLQLFIDSIWPPGISGAMIAMTPDGQVRALYSTPSYDPNSFVGGISSSEWRSLNTDPTLPLLNRALQVRYPPGSPFKLATAAMALKHGLVDLHTHMPVPCRGGMQYGNRYFKCWNKTVRLARPVGATRAATSASTSSAFAQLHALLEDGEDGLPDQTGIDLSTRSRRLSWLHRLLRQDLRPTRLEQCGDSQPLHRTGREYPDADQHAEVLQRAGRRRQNRDTLSGASRFGGNLRFGAHARPARRPAYGADRRGGARHGRPEPAGRSPDRRENRNRPESPRQGPWLVHRLCSSRETGNHCRRDLRVRRAWNRRCAVRRASDQPLPVGTRLDRGQTQHSIIAPADSAPREVEAARRP